MQPEIDDINDIKYFIKNLEDDQEFLSEILSSYPQEIEQRIKRVENAVKQKNANDIEKATHKFIALFSTIFIRTAANLSHELQSAARSNQIELCEKLFKELQSKIIIISSYIKSIKVNYETRV